MKSEVMSLDAPIGGWNVFDGLDNMPPTDAVILDNLVPGTGTVDTRQGYIEYTDLGTGTPCETVASFNSATDSKLLAASGGGMWDITDTTPLVSAQVVGELAAPGTFVNNRWQTENFRTAGETGRLIMVNGVDTPQVFDGTALVVGGLIVTESDGADPPSQVPITPPVGASAEFIGVENFKGRCYYWYDDDDAFYYTNAGAYQGEVTRFPMGAFVQRGGKLVMVTTWTQQDSGDGRDDFIVFVFSTGEVLVYQGDDPGGIGFFEQVGRYFTASPLSIRGRDKYGSDIIIMTKDGYVGLSSIIQQGRTSDVPQFSRKIHGAIGSRTERGSDLFGWDCILFQEKGLFIFNVPLSDETFEQHVMNTVTNTWCRFKNINVNCIEAHNDRLFGGTNDGRVFAILETDADDGKPIYFTSLYAFNYMGNPGANKHLTAAQILSTHSAPEALQLTGYADFNVPTLPDISLPADITLGTWSINPATPSQPSGSFWDEDYWSREGVALTYKGWQNVSGYGYAIALLVRFAKVNEAVSWRSTTLRYHMAGSQ